MGGSLEVARRERRQRSRSMSRAMRTRSIEPSTDQILAYCADEPGRARLPRGRRASRHAATSRHSSVTDGALQALCHLGTNVVPSGEGCGAFAELASRVVAADADRRGEARSASSGSAARRKLGRRARTGPASPSTSPASRPSRGRPGSARRPSTDLDLLVPACARAHQEELGVDPLRRDANGFRWRTRVADRGGALVALGRGRRDPVQGRGVRVDADRGAAPAGLGRSTRPPTAATRPGRSATCSGCCSRDVPAVCLFVRAENDAGDPALRDGRHAARPRLPERAPLSA